MGAKSAAKSYTLVFLQLFELELLPKTLVLHALYGANKVLCTGLVECGGVIVDFLLRNGERQAHPFVLLAKPPERPSKT